MLVQAKYHPASRTLHRGMSGICKWFKNLTNLAMEPSGQMTANLLFHRIIEEIAANDTNFRGYQCFTRAEPCNGRPLPQYFAAIGQDKRGIRLVQQAAHPSPDTFGRRTSRCGCASQTPPRACARTPSR